MVDLILKPSSRSDERVRFVHYLAVPPRRLARGREHEQIWLALWASASKVADETSLKGWLEQAATHYYRTRGSVSLALRQAFEHLNWQALAFNQAQKTSSPFLGAALVLRGEQVYLALSGPVHAYLFAGQEMRDALLPEQAGRGLGIGQAWGMRFYLWAAQPGAGGVLTVMPWPSEGQGLPKGMNFEAAEGVWVEVKAGSGQIRLAESQPVLSRISSETPHASPSAPIPGATVGPAPSFQSGEARMLEGGVVRSSPTPVRTPPARSDTASASTTVGSDKTSAPSHSPRPRTESAARFKGTPLAGWGQALAGVLWHLWQGWKRVVAPLKRGIDNVLSRVLPAESTPFRISPSTLAFLAVAIPLMVVTVAVIVYWQQGRMEQHRLYLQQAQQVVSQALGQSDPALKRVNLEAALTWVDKAEQYGQSADSKALRMAIYQNLDALAGVQRLTFQALLPGGIGGNIQIGKIVAAQSEDLYLLDRNQGNILRLVATESGYALDTQFACRPGQIGSLIVGPFVDMVALPVSNLHGAQVMAIDANGNLVYCGFKGGQTVLDAVALQPPDQGWGEVKGIAVRQGNLIVMDAIQNGLYEYRGSQWDFVDRPKPLFGSQVISLSNAMSVVAFQEDIFILFDDGHVSRCSGVGSVECQDPFPFRLTQDGQVREVPRLDVMFSDWVLTPPPDPAIYLLESSNQSVYYVSLMLSVQQQFRPSLVEGERLPQRAATAFTVTPGRNLVLAFGNMLYSARLP